MHRPSNTNSRATEGMENLFSRSDSTLNNGTFSEARNRNFSKMAAKGSLPLYQENTNGKRVLSVSQLELTTVRSRWRNVREHAISPSPINGKALETLRPVGIFAIFKEFKLFNLLNKLPNWKCVGRLGKGSSSVLRTEGSTLLRM